MTNNSTINQNHDTSRSNLRRDPGQYCKKDLTVLPVGYDGQSAKRGLNPRVGISPSSEVRDEAGAVKRTQQASREVMVYDLADEGNPHEWVTVQYGSRRRATSLDSSGNINKFPLHPVKNVKRVSRQDRAKKPAPLSVAQGAIREARNGRSQSHRNGLHRRMEAIEQNTAANSWSSEKSVSPVKKRLFVHKGPDPSNLDVADISDGGHNLDVYKASRDIPKGKNKPEINKIRALSPCLYTPKYLGLD